MKKSITVLSTLFLVLALSSGAFAAKALLTGDDIKNGSLSGVDVKRGSLGASLLTASAKNSLRGATGADGAKGAAGRTGVTGLAGVAGLTGTTGTTGSTGVNGLAGTNGTAGIDGTDGLAGSNGAAGTNGTNGAAGVNGVDGVDGDPGANGTVTPLSAVQGLTLLPTATPPTTVVSLVVPAGNYVILAKTQLYHSGAGDSVTCELKAGTTTIDQIAMKTLPALAEIPASLQTVTELGSTTTLSVQCDVSVANGEANHSSLIALPTS